MKTIVKIAALFAALVFALGVAACDNGSNDSASLLALTGGGNNGQQTGGGSGETGAGENPKPTAASGEYSEFPAGTDGTAGTSCAYVSFGLWPQALKADSVTVDENESETHGALAYCKGSDGEWYVKQAENACESGFKYSDGTTVGQGGASEKWFKVEPIKWRVLTDNYGGGKLLLAESVLAGGVPYYIDKSGRSIGGGDVSANNYMYSTIRAYLNGSYEPDDPQAKRHSGKGFLQSAFTSAQQDAIMTTTVVNNARSTCPNQNVEQWGDGDGVNSNVCEDTSDKIFLLSEQEATIYEYSFGGFNEGLPYGNDSRVRIATDFAMASGANQAADDSKGSWWWLRTPSHRFNNLVNVVGNIGKANNAEEVCDNCGGVAPALVIKDTGRFVHNVGCECESNGTVEASPANAAKGETVTLTIRPANGYVLATLTVNAEDGGAVATSGTGNIRTFTMPAQNVTVNATFLPHTPASGAYSALGSGTSGTLGTSGSYVTFGLWPQTIKAEGVTVDKSVTETHGALVCFKGSDGEWYVKQVENACESGLQYSDGTAVGQGGTSYKWFKVESIKWRVLSANCDGAKLLLAESILIARRYNGEASNNYKDSEIRAWLNEDFLQSAFSSAQLDAIRTTSVNNGAISTNPDFNSCEWNGGINNCACEDTNDKIFLLSLQEATRNEYGFDKPDVAVAARVLTATDFAKASGANERNTNLSMMTGWWLRSPRYDIYWHACHSSSNGQTGYAADVRSSCGGVVPALRVEN